MPTYDYVCESCDHAWDEFQSMTAKPTKKCPSCGKPKAKRQIGAGAGVIFKGSGFYITDYRSDSYKKAAAADSKSNGSGPDAKASTKTDSKPSGGESSKPAKSKD